MFSKKEALKDYTSVVCSYHWADGLVVTVIVHDEKETLIFLLIFISDC